MSNYGMTKIIDMAQVFGLPIEWVKDRRIACLKISIDSEKKYQADMITNLSNSSYGTKEFVIKSLQESSDRIKKIQKEIIVIEHWDNIKNNSLNPEMIWRAKEYPIENLIEVKRGMALCINHLERNPSMNCKNNFVYCHSCGFTGDTITVVMKLENLNFVEAVRRLQ